MGIRALLLADAREEKPVPSCYTLGFALAVSLWSHSRT